MNPTACSRIIIGLLIPILLFAPGCATTGTATSGNKVAPNAMSESKKPRYICQVEFLNDAGVKNLNLGNEFQREFEARKPAQSGNLQRRSVGAGLVAAGAVWLAKNAVIWISERIKERAKEYTATFGGNGVGPDWKSGSQYTAVSLERWKIEGSAMSLTHIGVFVIQPMNSELQVYQLEPIYWRCNEPAPRNKGKLTSVVNVQLNTIGAQAAPLSKVIDFNWKLSDYEPGKDYIYRHGTPASSESYLIADASVPFILPEDAAVLYGTFSVAEVDASDAQKLLELLGETIGKQADAVGGFVQGKLQ